MRLLSPAFDDNQLMPLKYSAYSNNISPPLLFEDVMDTTASLVLIMEDPDAPTAKPYQHWLVWNIPHGTTSLSEGQVPTDCRQGMNDNKSLGYFGPKPPFGTHHYIFKLIAIDIKLDLETGATRSALDQAISGHTIESAIFTGLFKV
jgi:Raf kinase inhibitor-like YbhB/YbcL family protein